MTLRMKNTLSHNIRTHFFGTLGGILFILMGSQNLSAKGTLPLDDIPHIHAIAGNPSQPDKVYLATHVGLFLAASRGDASQISKNADDFIALVRHPADSSIYFASGHPAAGGNFGVLKSVDGGKTWKSLSGGVKGPVAFHAMAIDRADPNVIYGTNEGLQVSIDGGKNWTIVEGAPKGIFDLATSARAPGVVYAATRTGLVVSRDTAKSWQPAYPSDKPATMVNVAADGTIRAFIYGVGLVTTEEKNIDWRIIPGSFQDRYLWRLITDSNDKMRLYAVADTGVLMISKDAGETWASFDNNDKLTPALVAKGEALFRENCVACHGERGVGERPEDMYGKDDFGFVAPPLDNSAHGWHHSDQGLVKSILDGSDRNERMISWKDTLSREDAESLVAYIKSLWNFRSIACQGSRHMMCMK